MTWGDTPWRLMERDELEEHVERLYAASEKAVSALCLCADALGPSAFWSEGGAGARAQAMLAEACTRARGEASTHELYRGFFRYAMDLLFKQARVGFGWAVCAAGHMMGRESVGSVDCPLCPKDGAHLVRPIRWEDLARAERDGRRTA